MVILGIDPGYAIIGYGAIEFKCGKYIPLGYGAILTSSKDSFFDRIEIIYNKISEITKIFEYTPLQVKTAVTGYGKAQKNQVMMMTQRLLNLKEIPKPDDTADALAIAICHANSLGYQYINRRCIRA